MSARSRRLAAGLASAAAALALTGCEQPTPAVTLYSGTGSVHDDAFSYCFDGQDAAKEPGTDGACRYDTASRTPKVLTVRPGDEVLVDVDKDLADAGWFVSLRGSGGKQSRLATQQEHVTSFLPDFSSSPTITVQVQKLESARDDAKPLGLWQFVVVPG